MSTCDYPGCVRDHSLSAGHTYTHDYEALGREAVALGWAWPARTRFVRVVNLPNCRLGPGYVNDRYAPTGDCWPEFSDELTALACIPWVRSVCAERWPKAEVSVCWNDDGTVTVDITGEIEGHPYWEPSIEKEGPTLPHAAIAAVKAAKETKP